jgi:hypothetical protein
MDCGRDLSTIEAPRHRQTIILFEVQPPGLAKLHPFVLAATSIVSFSMTGNRIGFPSFVT